MVAAVVAICLHVSLCVTAVASPDWLIAQQQPDGSIAVADGLVSDVQSTFAPRKDADNTLLVFIKRASNERSKQRRRDANA